LNKALIIFILGIFTFQGSFTQNKNFDNSREESYFNLRGSVYEKSSYSPYKNVRILVNGGLYTTTDTNGDFTIRAKIGDELIISHEDFETIYHTISSKDRITIEVIEENLGRNSSSNKQEQIKAFNRLIDSADAYLKVSAEKSIKFIGDALNEDVTSAQSAIAHELLGDVYYYWKQYDLAVSAYKISIQNSNKISTNLKLAKTYLDDGKIDLSLSTYNEIEDKKLSNYQKVLLAEGLGDANMALKAYKDAVSFYESAVALAKKNRISPKIIDLNSKIARVYSAQGEKTKAKKYYSNALSLAESQDKERAVEEQIEVAEFNSDIKDYAGEIALRKQAVEGLKEIELDSVIPIESPNTIQKQSYKIGNAYYLTNDFENAISYLEKSIEESDKKGDLVVKKDAMRKLSEALISKGDTEEGIKMINEYKDVVDELYALKEQEISRAARFSRNIAEQQNRISSLESDRRLSLSKFQLTQERNKRQKVIIYSLVGGLILLLITGFFMYKYIKQQKLANNLLALKSLRSQMNPHFIFNALNSVNSFIATNDERSANKYLSDFSRLMRSVLENSEEDFIPLKEEIELIKMYTKLEHFRFQDKFDFDFIIDEAIHIEAYEIPPMLLQPYIENAVWHGLRYKEKKGLLTIAFKYKSQNEIEIVIKDDGIGRERSKALKTQNQKKQKSKGMNNIKKRVAILNDMHKDKVTITVKDYQPDEENTGTIVTVTLKKAKL
jgi:tetratricopeptide (TPR) repeat protein